MVYLDTIQDSSILLFVGYRSLLYFLIRIAAIALLNCLYRHCGKNNRYFNRFFLLEGNRHVDGIFFGGGGPDHFSGSFVRERESGFIGGRNSIVLVFGIGRDYVVV